MPKRNSKLAETSPRGDTEVRSKLVNRFYEPIVLLWSLNAACIHNRPSKNPELTSEISRSNKHDFHHFVNKLAQLCDSKRGGDTVTSFVVLEYPDHIEYRFTSNQRRIEEFDRTKHYTTSLLQLLGNAQKHELPSVSSSVLQVSLSFNRSRVSYYVNTLKKEASFCISACEKESTNEVIVVINKLEELRDRAAVSSDADLSDDAFSKNCEALIKFIDLLYHSEIDGFIRDKAKEGRIDQSEHWCDLRHATGRLLSYLQAVKALVSARTRWPELFENFEVCYVASSRPSSCPFRGRSSPERLSAQDMIGRMTSNQREMAKYRSHAQELQKHGLDTIMREKADWRTFRPLVHAEVLLLDSLEKDGGTHPSRFYSEYKYIGCSKPTCLLCAYYFSIHESGVEVRPTHRNLYPYWRMPDVCEHDGLQAGKDREDLMNKIVERVRKDAFRVLQEKLPDGKRHDSNTEPTYPNDSISGGVLVGFEHLSANLKELDLDFSEYEDVPSP